MQDLLTVAKDFAAIAITLCGLGLWLWCDLRRQDRERREWLRENNWPAYVRDYGEEPVTTLEELRAEWDELLIDDGNPVG